MRKAIPAPDSPRLAPTGRLYRGSTTTSSSRNTASTARRSSPSSRKCDRDSNAPCVPTSSDA